MNEPAEFIGEYRIEGLLGRGGMGEVYLAWDTRLRRHVAIKRIRRRSGANGDERTQFLREAQAAAGLVHPAIVQIYDFLELDTGDCLVMEHVEGETVRTFLRSGALDLQFAIRLGREVAEGLATAHRQELVHRDLKSENVMVTTEGHAKILDFGLALVTAGDASWGRHDDRILGTPHAMAPEQILQNRVGPSADLFALGVLLHEMITGRRPFEGKNTRAILDSVLNQPFRSLGETANMVPQELEKLIGQLLEKQAERRPPGAQYVAAALRHLEMGLYSASAREVPTDVSSDIDNAPTSSFSSKPRTLPSSRRRSRRWWAVGALLCGLAWIFSSQAPSTTSLHPRRVVVLEPEIVDDLERLDIVASAVLMSSLDHFASSPRIQGIDPSQIPPATTLPIKVARATGADDVLQIRIVLWPGIGCRVSLFRIDGQSGEVLWTESFEAPIGYREMRLIADSVAYHLTMAYPQSQPEESAEFEVRDLDYAELLTLWQGFKNDGLANDERQERIAAVLTSSPRFLIGHLLGADLALTRFSSNRDPDQLLTGRTYIEAAEALAPHDPRPLYRRVRLALLKGHLGEAEESLSHLREMAPGDLELLTSGASLAERQGRLDRARELLQQAAERSPSWQTYYRLAALEVRGGWIADARRHLEQVLDLAAESAWGRIKLAELELLHGNLDRAATLYREQLARGPRRSLYTNLGLVFYLQRKYVAAVDSYQQALALAPEHPVVLFNLADAELAMGRSEDARNRYRQVLTRLESLEKRAALDPDERMTAAQCHAHLGASDLARQIADEIFASFPTDGEIALQRAVIYALTAEAEQALPAVQQALALGVQPRWFSIPAFDNLRKLAGFGALLSSQPPVKS